MNRTKLTLLLVVAALPLISLERIGDGKRCGWLSAYCRPGGGNPTCGGQSCLKPQSGDGLSYEAKRWPDGKVPGGKG